MSVRVMADIWDVGPDDPTDCAVLLSLANYSNEEGSNCFPSIERIAHMARRTPRTVQRSLLSLEAAQWIVLDRGVGRGNVSQYTINVPRLKQLQSDAYLAKKKVTPATSEEQLKGDTDAIPETVKGDTVTLKGDTDAIKGDIDAIPPHPLIGRSISDPPITKRNNTCAEPDKSVSTPEAMTVFDLPLVQGQVFGVPQSLYSEFIPAFPGVSVMAELAKMRMWLITNPTRMKTRRGMPAFMNAWLSRAQNQQPQQGGNGNGGYSKKSVQDNNFAESQRLSRILAQRRGDQPGVDGAFPVLQPATNGRSRDDLHRDVGGPDRPAIDDGVKPGADGSGVLAIPGGTEKTGRS